MSNLVQIARLLVSSLVIATTCSLNTFAQDYHAITQVSDDTVWLKWIPLNYNALVKLSDGATISRVEVNFEESTDRLDYTNGVKWVVSPVKERFDSLDRSDSLQDRTATFLEPVLFPISIQEQEYVFGITVIENVVNADFQYALGNIIVDASVEKDKNYAYRVEVTGVEPFYVFVEAGKETNYSIPELELTLDRRETVVCNWDLKSSQKEAFAFEIEHRVGNENGVNQVLNQPYLPYKSEYELNKDIGEVRHNEPTQGQVNYYRVVGLNAFGMRALYSDWEEIYVPLKINGYPIIDSINSEGKTRIISSHIITEGPNNADQIILYRSSEMNTGYEVIEELSIENSSTENFVFEVQSDVLTGDAHYYKIGLKNADDTVYSEQFYFFTLDQEPPKAPKRLEVNIDSSGVASLSWLAIDDPGLIGYRVFRANRMEEEFIEQTSDLVHDLEWRDTLALNNLTSEIYYYIEGVDANFNQGEHSDTVMGMKPDTIAPVASIIRTIQANDSAIVIKVTYSTSDDVDYTELYRNGKLLRRVNEDIIDSNLEPGNFYEYYLTTYDNSGNKAFSKTISQRYEPGYRAAPTGEIQADFKENHIEIKYSLPSLDVYSVQVYKSIKGSPLRLWKTIKDSEINVIQDTAISIGEVYEYQVKYITTEGIHSLPLKLEVQF